MVVKMDNKELLEKILDEWHMALYGDLIKRPLNEFAEKYPNLVKFGEWLSDLEDEINGQ